MNNSKYYEIPHIKVNVPDMAAALDSIYVVILL
jgi:hypothetical protein